MAGIFFPQIHIPNSNSLYLNKSIIIYYYFSNSQMMKNHPNNLPLMPDEP